MSEVRQRPLPVVELPACPAPSGVGILAGRGLVGVFRFVAMLAVGLVVVAGLLCAGLAWRLSQGPLDITRLAQAWAARQGGMHVGRATVAWAGFEHGAGRALDLHVEDVQHPDGFAARQADVAVSVTGLLHGDTELRFVRIDGVSGTITRPDGGGSMDGGGAMRMLQGPEIRQLRSIEMHDADLSIVDPRWGTWRLSGDIDLRRTSDGAVVGHAAVQAASGEAETRLDLKAEVEEGGSRLALTLAPIDLQALSRAGPGFNLLGAVKATVGGTAVIEVFPDLSPRSIAVQASSGAGQAGIQEVTLPFQGVSVDATAAWDQAQPGLPQRMVLNAVQAVLASPSGLGPSTVAMHGTLTRDGPQVHAAGELTIDRLAFADLPGVWPAKWGGHARPWLVENLDGGTARNGRVTAAADMQADGSNLHVTAFDASLLGDDVTIHWLRPVPPVEHAQAILRMRGIDAIDITVPTARQGTMQISNGVVRITGLSVKDQDLTVSSDVSAKVPELLALLKHPRLHLLSDHPIPVSNPSGTLAGKLEVTLPLENNLDFDQVGIHAQGRLRDLRLGGVVAKRDLERGDIQIDVTQEGLHASGAAAVGSIPSQVGLEMAFRDGPPAQEVMRGRVAGRATPRQLAKAGLDAGGIMPGGTAAFTAEYANRRDGRGEVRVQADLRDAALSAAGWTKPIGAPARASARLVLLHDQLTGVDGLQAQGPGMQIQGRAEMVGDLPSRLVLDRIVLGPTQARGELVLPTTPGAPLQATLTGPVLDLSTEFGPKPARPASQTSGKNEASTPLLADIRFDRVLLSGERSIGGVQAHVDYDGKRLRALRFQSSGAERIQAVVAPVPGGRRLSVRAADAGAVLRALDVTSSVAGGSLAIEGQWDDRVAGSPLSGTADLSDFHIRDAPWVGKLLQALTVYGIGEAMSGPGLKFTRLIAPFVWNGDALFLGESQAFSASLGLTAKGRADLGRHTIDLEGTIVPAYALNAAPGRLPLVGRLFSPERGGGLISVTYGVHGALSDPSIAVNPLSALTPGLLRRLFKVFD